jgi:hypothetical protein
MAHPSAWAIAAVVLAFTSASAWAVGPSFDCSKVQTPEEQLICSNAALSRTELALTQAYYALRQQVGEAGWPSLKSETLASGKQMVQQCGVPARGPLPSNTANMVGCLAQAHERQRAIWISRLTGPAGEEASRPVEQHVALQSKLQALGFLPAEAALDGVYGGVTRTAILAWQQANNRPDTGFISNADAALLMNAAGSATAVAKPIPLTLGLMPSRTLPMAASPSLPAATIGAMPQNLAAASGKATIASNIGPQLTPNHETNIITTGNSESRPRNRSGSFFIPAIGIGLVLLIGRAVFANYRRALLHKAIGALSAEYPFILPGSNRTSFLCMDRNGERLRFITFQALMRTAEIMNDRVVPVASIISVELFGGPKVVTDYVTKSRKSHALGRAVVGGLLFGGVGAIVGGTTAGSKSATVAVPRTVYEPSELVFGLSNVANPVIRFSSPDHAQCELWLRRVEGAMARQSGHAVPSRLASA